MSVRILVGHEQGDSGFDSEIACLFDSVTGLPLAVPVFHTGEDGESAEDMAEKFLEFTVVKTQNTSPSRLTPAELGALHDAWWKTIREAA